MSIPNRIYRIGKAYLNRVRDRIEELDAEAERELESEADRPLPKPPPASGRPARDDTSVEAMMRRAEDRIRAARGETDAREEMRGDTNREPEAAASSDTNAAHYRVLGVPAGSDWPTVQSAYEKLARRCDVRRFPEGSEEQKDAARILERVNRAYEALRKQLDPLDSRFDKLEL